MPAVLNDDETEVLQPATSYGFAVIEFARDVLLTPLDPWQEWLVIRAGELLADGRPRFKRLLVIVARQNGKTHLLRVLTLFWMFVERWPALLGISSKQGDAKVAMEAAAKMATETPVLAASLPYNHLLTGNNDPHFKNDAGSIYRIAAANRKAGRSQANDRIVIDELREHRDDKALGAAIPTMNARPYGQAWLITNQGDESAKPMHALATAAQKYIKTGKGDARLGIFEWSAIEGTHILDPQGWAYANPNLGHVRANGQIALHVDDVAGPALSASESGDAETVTTFLTEIMCLRVKVMNPAIDPQAWADCKTDDALPAERSRWALVLDISPDGQHATAAAACKLADDRVYVRIAGAWSGRRAVHAMRQAMAKTLAEVKPLRIGWSSNGPGAALDADLRDRRKAGRVTWPPPGVEMVDLGPLSPAVCMGLAEQVMAGMVVYPADELLHDHVTGAEKLPRGDTWVFSRRAGADGVFAHVDAAYAAAGAVHLARTLPLARSMTMPTPLRPVR